MTGCYEAVPYKSGVETCYQSNNYCQCNCYEAERDKLSCYSSESRKLVLSANFF